MNPAAPHGSLTVPVRTAPAARPWRACTAVVLTLGAITCAYWQRSALLGLFGFPAVTPKEAYQRESDGPAFDHSGFDSLLRKYVDPDGWVDYEGMRSDATMLDTYIASLTKTSFDILGRDEKLALLINAYNAFTLRLILDHFPIESIKDIPASKRWKDKRWHIGSLVLSLDQIEHERLRPKFTDPRVHFALVCAAIGCPKLRNEAYSAEAIDRQLEDQTRYAHEHRRWFRFEPGTDTVHLSKLYDWYGGDFKQAAGSAAAFAARYSPPLAQALKSGRKPRIRWLDYDWALNDKSNAP